MKNFDVHGWNYKRRLIEQEDPRRPKDIEFDNAQAMDRLTPDDKDKMGKIQQMMDKERGMDSNETQYKKEANEWLKDTLEYIHDGDLIPRHYGSGLEDLNLIVDRLEELGIEASHNEWDFS